MDYNAVGAEIPEPPNESGLFQITLASSELNSYLKRLASEINNQSKANAKMMSELESLRKEIGSLSRNTNRISEEHAAKVAALQNSMVATVNQSQLRASTAHLQKQVESIGRLLEVTFDEDGAVAQDEKHKSPVPENSISSVSERPRKELEPVREGRQIETKNGQAIVTSCSTTPRSPSLASPNTLVSTGGGSLPIETNSPSASGGLRSVIDRHLQEWYRGRGLVDAKIRHEITLTSVKCLTDELAAQLREEIKATASELVTVGYFKEAHDVLKAEVGRSVGSVVTELEKQRKNQVAFESKMRAALARTVRSVIRRTRNANNRVTRFYEMMALPEPHDEDSDSLDSSDEENAFASGNDGYEDTPECAGDVKAEASIGKDSQEIKEASCSKDALPSKKPVRVRASSRKIASKLSGEQAQAVLDDDGTDAKTNAVIQSPVFVAFRQHVLNDISERIAAARSTQSSDIDIELLAMRNDIRQRVTSSRVVELIKQYTDTETPARVTALARQVAELFDEKVSIPDLNDGLRSKADVQQLESKANVEYVDKALKDVRERQDTLQSDVNLLIADRREYRDVVQQLLIQQQRLQAAVAVGAPVQRAPPGTVAALPSLGEARRSANLDSSSPDNPSASTIADGTSPSRSVLRSAADANGFAPRPLTELISPRVSGGPIGGAVIHSPCPPLPLLHKPQPPAGAVGLTSSQMQYVKFTSGDNISQSSSPRAAQGSSSSLSTTRAAVESKMPIAYTPKRGSTGSPKK